MKLKLNTAKFQNMVAKAVRGASMSNEFSITHNMAIQLKDNVLTLITTDNVHYLYIKESNVVGDDFYVVVPITKFSKLISKLTCEDVELELKQSEKDTDKLIVHGNGRYAIDLEYDENGELIEFPDPMSEDDGESWNKSEIKLSTIKLILSTARPAILPFSDVTASSPYTGYYMGDRIVATDSYKICGVDIKVFDDAKLLPQALVNLFDVMAREDISIKYNDDTVIFSTDDVVIYGHTHEGLSNYKIDAISSLLDEKFPSSCKIDKSLLIQMLERLSLFVDSLDKNSVYLTFTKDGLIVSNKRDKGEEIIPYLDSQNFKDYTCCLDIDMFKAQVRAYPIDNIEILYGKNSLKFVTENVKQVVALADDDRLETEDESDES